MAPADRRAAVIDATIPLLRTHGVRVTTRQIADAAGVAEGTVFSVFDGKESLMVAAIEAALSPESNIARIAELDPDLDLEDRLERMVAILQEYVASTWQLLSTVARSGPAPRRSPDRANEASVRLTAAVAEHLASDADRFRQPVAEVARSLVALTVGCSHPAIIEEPMSPAQIVDLLLDGVRGGRTT